MPSVSGCRFKGFFEGMRGALVTPFRNKKPFQAVNRERCKISIKQEILVGKRGF